MSYDLETQVRPSIRSLKAVGISTNDIWFLLTKRLDIMAEPTSLERWLDFVVVHGISPRDIFTFLLRSPPQLFTACTLHQAGQVITYLRGLGVKPEYLCPRIVCVWPDLLLRDVQQQLQPVVSYLISLGLESLDITRLICVYPELLLTDVEDNLAPFVDYLRCQGCSTIQAAALLQQAPQLLRSNPQEAFSRRLAALFALGISKDQLASMVAATTEFLITAGAPDEQLAFLQALNLTQDEVSSTGLCKEHSL